MGLTVTPKEISPEQRHMAEAFQDIVRLGMESFTGKRGNLEDLNKFKELKRRLKRYSNYPFAREMMDRVRDIDARLKEYFSDRRPGNLDRISQEIISLGNQLWENPGWDSIGIADRILKLHASLQSGRRKQSDVLGQWQNKNPFFKENPLFFGETGLIRQFEIGDMQRVVDKDLDDNRYSYLPFKEGLMGDYEYMAHWISELRDSPEPIELSGNQFKRYSRFAFDQKSYGEIEEMVSEYLHSNDKDLIPQILKSMQKIPSLVEANEDYKSKLSGPLYRGIPSEDEPDDYSVDDIVNEDKMRSPVAMSESFHSARNFALQKGHLMSDEARRSEFGVVLTYQVPEDAIILCTQIFGGIFNEDEVLVDARKCQLSDWTSV